MGGEDKNVFPMWNQTLVVQIAATHFADWTILDVNAKQITFPIFQTQKLFSDYLTIRPSMYNVDATFSQR